MSGLTNADFRALLATPRPGATGGGGGGGGNGDGGEEKQKKHKKPKPFKPGGKLGIKEGEEAEDGSQYRWEHVQAPARPHRRALLPVWLEVFCCFLGQICEWHPYSAPVSNTVSWPPDARTRCSL